MRAIRRDIQSYVESHGENLLIGLRGTAQETVLGLAGGLVHAYADFTREEIVSFEIIIPNLAVVGGTRHIRHENTRIFWQFQIEGRTQSRGWLVPFHNIGNLRQVFRQHAGFGYGRKIHRVPMKKLA